MRSSRRRSPRPARRDRARAVMEALEPRVLLTVTFVHDTGNITTNGTNLQNAINAAALGDTIVLDANAAYLNPGSGFTLPYKTGTGTLTIESADVYNGLGHLPAGVRVNGAVARYMPRLLTHGGNAPIIKTVLKDSAGNTVTTGAHDYALIGLEMCPQKPTDTIQSLVILGEGSTAQSTLESVANNILVDRCYVHGLDPVSATIYASYQCGITLNSASTTISNSEVSNIHTQTPDGKAIAGSNGTGPFNITNNYLEGSSECFLLGGATTYIPNNVTHDITFTNNHLAKRLSWNPYDPSFYDPDNGNFGIKWNIKNLFELKNAERVLIDGNLMDNSWVLGDQVGPAVLFTPRNQTANGENPWNTDAHITFSNNVIRYVGEGIQIAACPASNGFYPTAAHDITIRNNVFESIDCRGSGPGYGIIVSRGRDAMTDLVIDHNTFYNSQAFMVMGTNPTYETVITSGLVVTNNVCQFGDAGLQSTAGNNLPTLNTSASGISVTNPGSGYTAAPAVAFQGGGGSGAAGTAMIDGTTHVFLGIKMTNRGSGYTSVPTIQLSGGGGTGAAASFAPDAIVNGQLGAWTFTNNLIYGAGPNSTNYPPGNFFTATEDATFIRDPAGELNGLLPTSIGHNAATDGTDCGVNPATLAPTDFVPLDASVQGYWKFDEGTGTNASDSSLVGTHQGTLSSSSLWTTSGQSYDAIAITGGTSGSMSVSSFTTAGTFSFAAWVKPAAFGADSYIASADNSAFSLYVNSAGKLVATTSNGATVTDSTSLTAGTWYLVGCTYDGATKTLTLYRNGVAVGNNTTTGTIASGSTTLYLGGNGGSSNCFNGSIDEARYYNSDMSALTFNGVVSMKQLYDNFGPLIGSLSPGTYTLITGATSTFGAYSVATHCAATYRGAPAVLVFTWSVYDGPAGVTFDANNGTTAGQSCVATWPSAGKYVMQLDLTDPVGGRTVFLHPVTVSQVAASASISPSAAALSTGGAQQFTYSTSGIDQFGDPLTGNWTWTVASGGVIDPKTGLYNAPASAGSDTVNLLYNGSVAASAAVTVTGAALPSVTVSATDNSAAEKWNPTGEYTITRTGDTSAALTVNYTMGGTATNSVDYSTLGTTVVIPAGSASAKVTITPIDDTLIEGNESAILTLTIGAGYAVASPNAASVNIDNATEDIPTITISATDAAASETGPDVGVFTLTRSGTYQYTPGALAVGFSVSGTAANTFDYGMLEYNAVFMPGQMTTTVTITPVVDTLVEGSETVILTVMAGTYNSIGSPSAATVTIADYDPLRPVVTVLATDPDAAEEGLDPGVFTIARTISTGAMTVHYSISGTATSAADYDALPASVVIPDGGTSATITVTPIDDTLIEGDETVILTISADAGYSAGPPSTGTVTIIDNESVTVAVLATDANAAEQGQNAGVFTVTRTAGTAGALTVDYVMSGTAGNAADYSSLSGSVVIPAGSSSATITVTPVDDTLIEGSETVILTIISGAGYTPGTPGAATVTIADNDIPSVTMSATTPSASETGPTNGVFTVTRTGSGPALLTGTLTVNYAIGGTAVNGADYGTLGTTVVIPAGLAAATITIAVIDDTLVEGSETAILTVTSGSGYTIGSPSIGTVTIADNDIASVTISATDAGASETGPDSGTFTVTRSGSVSSALTVNYSITGTAVNTSDYSTLAANVVIPAGSAAATITVAPIDDTLIEGDETVILTITSGTGYVAATPSIATVTIADNDIPSVTISATDPMACEGPTPDAGTFTVTRAGSGPALLTGDLTVNYSISGTAANGADYGTLGTTAVIPAGSAAATITVAPLNDVLAENTETVILAITTGAGYTVGAPGNATVSIADNRTIAYEGFNYSTGTGSRGPLDGANSGYGFSNAWSVTQTGSYSSVSSGSLSYSYNGQTLDSSGNDATIWWTGGYANATRTISDSGWGVSGSSRWFAFEMSQHKLGANDIYSHVTLNGLNIGNRVGSGYGGDIILNGNRYYVPATGAVPAADVTVFIVVRIDFGDTAATPDKIYMWANNQGGTNDSLTPGTIPSDSVAGVKTIPLPDCLVRGSSAALTLQAEQGNVQATYDEIRYGTNYYSVAPRATIRGDANRDGVVDAADYAAWFNNFGTGVTWEQANFKGYGVTDASDYADWFNNYGMAGSSAADLTSGGAQIAPDVSMAAQIAAIPAPGAEASTGSGFLATTTRIRQSPSRAVDRIDNPTIAATYGSADLLGPVQGPLGGTTASARPRRWPGLGVLSMDMRTADGLIDILGQSALRQPLGR